MTKPVYELEELQFESSLGEGIELEQSSIPLIDLRDFAQRRETISTQLWQAATEVGFFQIYNHSLSLDKVEQAFALSQAFFALPDRLKARFPLKEGLNAGWEFMQQVRPSTGTADQKESFQITLPHMDELWPGQTLLPEFQRVMLDFEYNTWQLGMSILSCFAEKLGFESDFFHQVHDRSSPQYQSTLRLLHYLDNKEPAPSGSWRAGAHTDFDCLTMVFQQAGQGGLQVCAGKDARQQLAWNSVEPQEGVITCNIGDMLMRWSDDQLKSTLHRVRMPKADEYQGPRFSMAYFCQANKDVIIQGPKHKYQPISAADFLRLRINANFAPTNEA